MNLLFTIYHMVDLVIISVGWIILFADLYLRLCPPHDKRMERGKHARWAHRMFGPWGRFPVWFVFWSFGVVTAFTPARAVGRDVFLIYLGGAVAIDWITGSDDPPYRRWLASLSKAVEKLKIKPSPRPVIDAS